MVNWSIRTLASLSLALFAALMLLGVVSSQGQAVSDLLILSDGENSSANMTNTSLPPEEYPPGEEPIGGGGGGGGAEAPNITCGMSVDSDIILVENLTSSGTCFTVNASDITIDGDGHVILGNNSGYGIENSGGFDNITIKNFAGIDNFTNALIFRGVENSTITNNSISAVRHWTLKGGILLLDSSNHNTLTDNIISTSGEYADGLVLSSSDFNIVMSNNINSPPNSYSYKSSGILLNSSSSNVISYNNLSRIGVAISVYDRSDRNIISSNLIQTMYSVDYGIYLSGSTGANISGNAFNITKTYGIYIEPAAEFGSYEHSIDATNTQQGKTIYYLLSTESLFIENRDDIGLLYLVNTTNVTIRNVSLDKAGIILAMTTDTLITHSNLSTYKRCIKGDWALRTSILDNKLYGCDDALEMSHSDSSIISDNVFFGEGWDDVLYLSSSEGLIFTYNNLSGEIDRLGSISSCNHCTFAYNDFSAALNGELSLSDNHNLSLTRNYWGSTSPWGIAGHFEVSPDVDWANFSLCPILDAPYPDGNTIDCSGPEMSIISPLNGTTFTAGSVMLDVITNESAVCSYGIDSASSTFIKKNWYPILDDFDVLTKDELRILSNGIITNAKGSFDYNQLLYGPSAPIVEDGGNHALEFKAGENAYRYTVTFTPALASDITSGALDDIEDKTLTMAGRTYTFVNADGTAGGSVTLDLMTTAVKDTIAVGETKTYSVGDNDYEVTLTYAEIGKAKFTVDGVSTNLISVGEVDILSDGTELGLSEVLYQNYAGGIQSAEFYLGAGKIRLQDDNITDDVSSHSLVRGSDTSTDTYVRIRGSISASVALISQIEVTWQPGQGFNVPEGDNLSSFAADSQMFLDFDLAFFDYTSEEQFKICMGKPPMVYQAGTVEGDAYCMRLRRITDHTHHNVSFPVSGLSPGAHFLQVECSNYLAASTHAGVMVTYALPAPEPEPEPEPVSSGSSGGSGGGGSAPAVTTGSSVTRVITSVSALSGIDMPINREEIPLDTLIIAVTEQATNVEISVSASDDLPDIVPTAPQTAIYKYLVIEHENLEGKMQEATLRFRVRKDWLDERNLDSSEIVLLRFAGGAWEELPTLIVSETGNYVYYSSTSPGFSVFAISAKEAALPAEATIEAEPESAEPVTEELPEEMPEEEFGVTGMAVADAEEQAPHIERFLPLALLVGLSSAALFIYWKRRIPGNL